MTWEDVKKAFKIQITEHESEYKYHCKTRVFEAYVPFLNKRMMWKVSDVDFNTYCWGHDLDDEGVVAKRIIREFELEKYIGETIEIPEKKLIKF
jgi:hypothetical protein